MNEVEPSRKTRELLDAAKGDGPGALAKAKIWGGVAATTAAAAAGAGAGSAAAAVAGGSGKLVAVGALFGSAVTVGLAVALMRIGSSHAPPPPVPAPSIAANPQTAPLAPSTAPSAPALPTIELLDQDIQDTHASAKAHAKPGPASAPARAGAAGNHVKPRSAAADSDDALMRETLLVGEARGALMRGDAGAALATVRAARATGSHALEPEELALEAKALRALGRESDAAAIESTLRTRYPDHALAR